MNELQQLAAETALQSMAQRGFFSICVIDDILKLTGAIPDREAYGVLRLLHCVNFMDMPPKVLEQLPELIRACLNGPALMIGLQIARHRTPARSFRLYEVAVEVAPEPPKKKSWFAGLLK